MVNAAMTYIDELDTLAWTMWRAERDVREIPGLEYFLQKGIDAGWINLSTIPRTLGKVDREQILDLLFRLGYDTFADTILEEKGYGEKDWSKVRISRKGIVVREAHYLYAKIEELILM